jgi:bifunctional enzyme CysN/CysC
VVLVNKMDLVGYDQAVFERIRDEYSAYLSGIGVQPIYYIPVSGRDGAGVAAHNGEMSWYDGPTLLQALDSFEKARTLSDQPVRMPVQDVYKFSDMGDNRRIVAGTLSSGTLQPGDAVVFYPSAKRTILKTLEGFNTDQQMQVSAGQAVGFSMAEQIYVRRGQIACKVDEMPPAVSTRMRVSLFWLGRQPLSTDKTLILKLGTAREKAQIESIHRVIDASDYSAQNGNENLVIEHHDVAEVTLRLAHPIAFDTSDKLPDTSRFVLVDEYEIRGGGIVLEALPDEVSELRDEVNLRNQKWIRSHVTMEQRYEKYNQKSALVVITGPKGIGRKRLASLLERQLFEDGKLCYYLGIGSVLYGVNADLKRRDAINNWREHVRRFGELAHLFLDAGQILIVTAVEFTKSDLAILQTVIDEEMIKTVWLGEHVTTDLPVDLVFDHGESEEEMAIRIKRLLQDGGFIFKF